MFEFSITALPLRFSIENFLYLFVTLLLEINYELNKLKRYLISVKGVALIIGAFFVMLYIFLISFMILRTICKVYTLKTKNSKFLLLVKFLNINF